MTLAEIMPLGMIVIPRGEEVVRRDPRRERKVYFRYRHTWWRVDLVADGRRIQYAMWRAGAGAPAQETQQIWGVLSRTMRVENTENVGAWWRHNAVDPHEVLAAALALLAGGHHKDVAAVQTAASFITPPWVKKRDAARKAARH